MENKRISNIEKFLDSCKTNNFESYKFSKNSEISSFGLVFALFNYNFIGKTSILLENSNLLKITLEKNLKKYKIIRKKFCSDLAYDKPYLQLLSFTLSSLHIIKKINETGLEKEINNIFNDIGVEEYLNNIKAFKGKPGSGNFVMFYAINLLHKKIYFNNSCDSSIDLWIDLHLLNINKNGFWGSSSSNPYLQFQNGYHQYEIFNFLKLKNNCWKRAADFISTLSDSNGQFAPYPGGGGCFDYDAIYFLTSQYVASHLYKDTLLKTRKTLVESINSDGGYCESKYLRPRSIKNIFLIIKHIIYTRNDAMFFSFRRNINLLRNRNNRIKTHWTTYQRTWNESNLWDTWFRNLTILKIEKSLNLISNKDKNTYQFIDYPGIGYEINKY